MELLSANFTKATAPSVKVASNIKIPNMRFRALLLMEEPSAFSKEKTLLLSVSISNNIFGEDGKISISCQ